MCSPLFSLISRSPQITSAVPSTTTQCSSRRECRCRLCHAPGLISSTLTLKPGRSSSTSYRPHGRSSDSRTTHSSSKIDLSLRCVEHTKVPSLSAMKNGQRIYRKKLGTARLLSIRRSFSELASKAKDLCASCWLLELPP